MLALAMSFSVHAADGAALRQSFAPAVRAAAPAVVNIFALKRVVTRRAPDTWAGDPLAAQLLAGRGALQTRIQNSLGSGVIIDPSGVMVTNLHVIQGAEAVKILTADGRELAARLINSDEKLDLAIFKLDVPAGTKLASIRFGDSDTLNVGDVVLAVGNPYGIGQSVSMGIVSAVDRTAAGLSNYSQFIQTDVSINPGNSGGALIDSTGALVGINTAIFSKEGTAQGISFAIPANLVRTVARDIVTTGRVTRPWLGAEGQSITQALAAKLGLPEARGVLVSGVLAGSPAAVAGVKSGDVILALDGKPVADAAALNERILADPNLLGRAAPLTLWREGQRQTLQVTFEELPARRTADQTQLGGTGPLAGAVVEALSPALNVELNLPPGTTGVAVITPPNTPSRGTLGLNLQPGDLLLEINSRIIRTLADATRAANDRARGWQIKFQRGGRVFNVVAQ